MPRVTHQQHGTGTLVLQQADGISVVDFTQGGLLRVPTQELTTVSDRADRTGNGDFDPLLEVLVRLQAFTIQAVHQRWAVFSRSRIQLLPHQLWTCQKVMSSWPPRWLVADDVGLGKTIEAGLILQAAKARNKLRRLLILCPASLVDQWHHRLRQMFDLRCQIYSPDQDRPQDDYWGNADLRVIASFHTLREDRKEEVGESSRWERLAQGPCFDLVLFDEAHHMGSDEQGPTLAYRLLDFLQTRHKIEGLVLFTGTPHKGKDYSFLNLLRLLQPARFSPREGLRPHLGFLRDVMIRNSKHKATDLLGNRLFHGVDVESRYFGYSEPEQIFYDRLSAFICAGLLFAGRLADTDQRAVGLVLAALQKLAASSVAAIRRAIRNRIQRLEDNIREADALTNLLESLSDREGSDGDTIARHEERLVELSSRIALVENELPWLKELLTLADHITEETKIGAILGLIREELQERSVLLFTEYKATQSILLSALMAEYGPEKVTFINGDERAEEIRGADGALRTIQCRRQDAAEAFNSGKARFLVSTEAAGEGIDLQQNCHTLVHVDLPWNPMRMHQRVGRLYRYGQRNRVKVYKFHNPGTVESRIHTLLEEKLLRISRTFNQVMDEPEDMLQLVLGMTESGFFEDLFRSGVQQGEDGLGAYLDRLGNDQIVSTVQALLGTTAGFDFQGFGSEIPKVDLPDLKYFIQGSLSIGNRRMDESEGRISFLTPEPWKRGTEGYQLEDRYQNLSLDRGSASIHLTLGADHVVMRAALRNAMALTASLGFLAEGEQRLHVFRVFQQVDESTAPPDRVIGVIGHSEGWEILPEGELLLRTNAMVQNFGLRRIQPSPVQIADPGFVEAEQHLTEWCRTNLLEFHNFGLEWIGSVLGSCELNE